MELLDHLSEVIAVEVRIDLGGGDRLMAQHFLNGPKVCTSLDEVGSKGVAERVRTYRLLQPDPGGQRLNNVEHHHPAELFSATVEKHIAIMSFLYGDMNAYLVKIETQVL